MDISFADAALEKNGLWPVYKNIIPSSLVYDP